MAVASKQPDTFSPMPIEVVTTPGQLPPFWDRNVLFFSNIHSIFYDNVEETEHLAQAIAGANSYGGRLLGIIDLMFRGANNTVFLESEPDPGLVTYLGDALGLSIPSFAIMDATAYSTLRGSANDATATRAFVRDYGNHPAEWIDGYVTDAGLSKIANLLGKRTVSSVLGSKRGNNKLLLHQYLTEQGLPTFDTTLAHNRGDLMACLGELKAMGYEQAVIKAQIGASGFGMTRVRTQDPDLSEVADYLFFEGACMVQGWLGEEVAGVCHLGSPSVQFFVADQKVFLFDITEQVLSDESVHQGNVAPPLYLGNYPELETELMRQAATAASWLHDQDYRGTGSADFLLIEQQGNLRVILCEVNARVTGATYPALLARHFNPGHCWVMRNIRFRHPVKSNELLSLMDTTGLLYTRAATNGILAFNFNTTPDNRVIKGQFLFLGETYQDCVRALTHAESILHVGWEYDRD